MEIEIHVFEEVSECDRMSVALFELLQLKRRYIFIIME